METRVLPRAEWKFSDTSFLPDDRNIDLDSDDRAFLQSAAATDSDTERILSSYLHLDTGTFSCFEADIQPQPRRRRPDSSSSPSPSRKPRPETAKSENSRQGIDIRGRRRDAIGRDVSGRVRIFGSSNSLTTASSDAEPPPPRRPTLPAAKTAETPALQQLRVANGSGTPKAAAAESFTPRFGGTQGQGTPSAAARRNPGLQNQQPPPQSSNPAGQLGFRDLMLDGLVRRSEARAVANTASAQPAPSVHPRVSHPAL